MADFKKTFRAARASGKKEFTWNGKKYNTKLADSGSSKKTPVPADKPQRTSTTGPKSRPNNNPRRSVSEASKGSESPKKPAEKKVSVETGSRARNQEKARSAAPSGTSARSRAPADEKRDYPRPAKDVGVAKASSKIGQAAARRENTPKKKR